VAGDPCEPAAREPDHLIFDQKFFLSSLQQINGNNCADWIARNSDTAGKLPADLRYQFAAPSSAFVILSAK
jgi:hypothetical protein